MRASAVPEIMEFEPADDTAQPRLVEFIRARTQLTRVALVPEIRLHLAAYAIPLWEATAESKNLGPGNRACTGDLPLPFWAFAWAGGQALARYVLDRPEVVRDRAVLDVGSGSGIVAIAAALAGAGSVRAVDIDPLAVEAIGLNAEANGVRLRITATDVLGEAGADDDVVLVGDLFYERTLAERALDFLTRTEQRGRLVLVGDLGRPYLPRDRLIPLARYDVSGMEALEDADVKRTTVWRFASTVS